MPLLLSNSTTLAYVGVAFWLFLAAVVWAALWYAKSRNRQKHETIRLAIEKGTILDEAMIEAIDRPTPANPQDYRIGGLPTIAAGFGIIVLGFFLKKIAIEAYYSLIGAGILAILVGISLLVVAGMIERRNAARNKVRPMVRDLTGPGDED